MDTLNKIIKACFEAVWGTMVGGLVIYSLQSMRKNRRILIIVWLLISGMASWRFFMTNFYSPRYAVSFLFPAIIFTAFMLVKFKRWWWVLLTVLGIICCCKICRISPTGSLFSRSAAFIVADAENKDKTLVYIDRFDRGRVKFYSGLDVRPLPQFKSRSQMTAYLARIIKTDAKAADAVYMCLEISEGNAVDLNEFKTVDGEWKLLRCVLKNRKKKLFFHIYRYRKFGLSGNKIDSKNLNTK